jgi:hypothetical protein
MEEAPTREPKRLREDAAVTSAAAAAEEPQYVYLPIADAMKVPGVRVCLFAVVSEIGITDRSRGTGEFHPQVSTPSLVSFRAPTGGWRVEGGDILGFSQDFSRTRVDGFCLAVCFLQLIFSLIHKVFT